MVLVFVLALFVHRPAGATRYDGFIDMVTDPLAVFQIPNALQPLYLMPMREPTFGTAIVRVSGDSGLDVGTFGPRWGGLTRHVYSKQQPWNSTSLLLSIDNKNSGLTPVILNGQTYQPRYEPCGGYDKYDWRWHPSTSHQNEQVNVNGAGTELMWYDVTTCTKTRSWPLPFVADYGIGSGEGNVSNDGRYVVIHNKQQMVVVDMDPQAPNAPPYPYLRIGPVYDIPACSLDVAQPDSGVVAHASISPSGRFIGVKYKTLVRQGMTSCDTLCDMRRIFEVDSSLTIRVHNMASNTLRCGSFQHRPNGWIFPLKHADMALDPYDGDEDVVMGGRACPGASLGRVVKVRLRDGQVTALSNPLNEPPYLHGSARNLQRPGWFYVTYSDDPLFAGTRFHGEVMAVKMNGSGQVERFAHYHSTHSTYLAQPHAVPSPDGKRVMFASDWRDHCTVRCGEPGQVSAYVVDARESALLDAPIQPKSRELWLSSPRSNPSREGLVVRLALPSGRPTTLELFDVAGRRLEARNVGLLGPGEHLVDLDERRRLPTGVYLVTLTDGRLTRSTKAVVIR